MADDLTDSGLCRACRVREVHFTTRRLCYRCGMDELLHGRRFSSPHHPPAPRTDRRRPRMSAEMLMRQELAAYQTPEEAQRLEQQFRRTCLCCGQIVDEEVVKETRQQVELFGQVGFAVCPRCWQPVDEDTQADPKYLHRAALFARGR